jgi:hypothetical protein
MFDQELLLEKESQHTDMLASEISVDWVPQETPLGPINSGKEPKT